MTIHSVVNTAVRRLDAMFPGYFQTTTKRNHYVDFGYPDQVTFAQLWQMYRRNGIASAAVNKTILKTWQDYPTLQIGEESSEQSQREQDVGAHFATKRIWQMIAEADKRSLVGKYAGVIFRFADSKRMNEPVDMVPGGIEGLVEIIPAWEGQLTVSEWDSDEMSETYGKPKMFQFNEAAIEHDKHKSRSFNAHPDRVLIWSADGTVHGDSHLLAGYNDLIDFEKVKGAGGEGFWKNAKSAPVLQVDKEAKIEEMAKAMGVPASEVADKMDAQVTDWQKGFDALLMLQGIEAKTLGVTLPQPKEFSEGPLQSFAASWNMPVKILIGMQTGERASTEDANEWAQTCNARRINYVRPALDDMIGRLKRFNILSDADWQIGWTDLTEMSASEKIDRADKMADINQKMETSGEIVFTHEEMRAVNDLQPLEDGEKYRDESRFIDDEKRFDYDGEDAAALNLDAN